MTSKHPDEWALYEDACEIFAGIRRRLKAGAEGSGATFNADECELMLGHLRDLSPPNSRPARDWFETQADIEPIAKHCAELEKSDVLKNALKDTAKHFKCSISKVREARKQYRPLPSLQGRSFFK